jgi:hypothetical protein
LDHNEFIDAIRTEVGLGQDVVSDQQAQELFVAVDANRSGGIDAIELVAFLVRAMATLHAHLSSDILLECYNTRSQRAD